MMKIKTIKKAIAMFSLVAVSVCTFGMNVTVATGPETVTTTLSAGSGSGSEWRPIVKAKWEMNGPSWELRPTRNADGTWNEDGILNGGLGTDDDSAAGAQFNAPGIWGANMNYTVCAVATDPNGVADIDDVYADIYYPTNRPMHLSPSDPSDPAYDGNEIDNPIGGCGAKIEQNTLYRLSKDQGIDLFCNNLRVNNDNLVTFNPDYNWDEICNNVTGQLVQELAYVYCDDKTLTWEDPAGFYDVDVIGHDSDGPGAALENQFEYVEFTGFEIDFSSVNYQNVIQGVRNQVDGDRIFDPVLSEMPTVRNIGNTRLNLLIAQDDMDFDLRDYTNWNVAYDSRIGTDANDWNGLYDPFKRTSEVGNPTAGDYTSMRETLDLSETEKMDFVVLVEKWEHGTDYNYTGKMWLDAERTDFEEFRCIW